MNPNLDVVYHSSASDFHSVSLFKVLHRYQREIKYFFKLENRSFLSSLEVLTNLD